MRNIETKIVADSVNPQGKRITTFLLTYPRFIHAEIMTHRMLSRNAASSRAIPTSKIIQAINDNPARPEWWGANQSGMQAKEQITDSQKDKCAEGIFVLKYAAIDTVEELNLQGLHKQIANRYLEPWFHITVLVTATDWDNFFALRAHPDAQPEFQVLAYRMLDQYLNTKPDKLNWGEWHLPFTDDEECLYYNNEQSLAHSVACAARTSYTTHDDDFPIEKQMALTKHLSSAGHWSPFEHQAQAVHDCERSGNFTGGWFQYRQNFKTQNREAVDLYKIFEAKPDWVQL